MKRTLLIFYLLSALGFFCNNAVDNGITICFSFQDLETEFWVGAHKAITGTLKERGIRVLERNAGEDANRQLEQIRDAIAQGVDGIIMIPQDGQSANTIIGEANEARVPIAVFNRPPADSSRDAIVIVADNQAIAENAVDFLVEEAAARTGKSTPCIVVGDLGDPNAVERKNGFYTAIRKRPELFNPVIQVPSKWDANTTFANFEAALQANPEIDFVFTSSDFLYPQIRAVLEPLGKWVPQGDEKHVILGGLDGDQFACRMMKAGIVDATGVQDLFFEAETVVDELLKTIEAGEIRPKKWIKDSGFALTRNNFDEKHKDMWGCKLLREE